MKKSIKERGEKLLKDVRKAHEKVQEQNEKLKKLGGIRPGAGRPKGSTLPPEERASQQVNFRLKPAQVAAIEQQQQRGESFNQAARRLLLQHLNLED